MIKNKAIIPNDLNWSDYRASRPGTSLDLTESPFNFVTASNPCTITVGTKFTILVLYSLLSEHDITIANNINTNTTVISAPLGINVYMVHVNDNGVQIVQKLESTTIK